MSTFEAIVLGIIQSFTEFAPVSSSGHLIIVPWLFEWRFFLENPELNKTFDVALHVGTFLGAIVYFRRDIARYLAAWFRSMANRRIASPDERIAWFLVVGTLPGALTGFVLEGFIEEHLGRLWLIAVMLAVFGILLYVVDRRASENKQLEDLRLRDALVLGTAQALALQPGVSRSGVTITAARGLGISREAATRFSFLLSLPIIGGAGLYEGIDLARTGLPPGMAGPFMWGMVASAITGFLAVWFVIAYVRRRTFAPFVVYRLALAGLVLGLIATGARSASGL